MDGDGQHDPEFLNTMAKYLVEHQVDMVIGSRFIEKKGFQSSITRRMGIQFFSKLIKVLTGKKITDPTSGLRMIGRNVMEIFSEDYPRDYPEPESIVAVLRKNMKIEEIPVVMLERQGGVSSISPKKSIYYMIKVTSTKVPTRDFTVLRVNLSGQSPSWWTASARTAAAW